MLHALFARKYCDIVKSKAEKGSMHNKMNFFLGGVGGGMVQHDKKHTCEEKKHEMISNSPHTLYQEQFG